MVWHTSSYMYVWTTIQDLFFSVGSFAPRGKQNIVCQVSRRTGGNFNRWEGEKVTHTPPQKSVLLPLFPPVHCTSLLASFPGPRAYFT